ncbi:MAG: lipase family protein [Sideroxyarcus sp.]|nr:lipase family protein [Sideroxyarcus sp.]
MSTLKGSITQQQLSSLLVSSGFSFTQQPTYSVNYYKVAYETTTPSGAAVIASGLLIVPQKAAGAASPLLSVQHGTITSQALAPSNANLAVPNSVPYDVWGGVVAASFGYVVAMPDYLGYGDSQSVFHPYVQAAPTATATIDMIRASKTILGGLGVAINQQLFLAGYSEGGYATLATQKQIETNLSSEFTLTASAPGAGPYDLTATVNSLMASQDMAGQTLPGYFAFVVDAYHAYYDSASPLGNYFTPSALACANTFFADGWYGFKTGFGTFDSCVSSTVTADILNATFIADYTGNNPSTSALRQAFADNDIYDWAPQVHTRFYYSPNDEAVPPANAITAFNTMQARGSTTVEIVECQLTGITNYHGSCNIPYFENMVSFFDLYAADL